MADGLEGVIKGLDPKQMFQALGRVCQYVQDAKILKEDVRKAWEALSGTLMLATQDVPDLDATQRGRLAGTLFVVVVAMVLAHQLNEAKAVRSAQQGSRSSTGIGEAGGSFGGMVRKARKGKKGKKAAQQAEAEEAGQLALELEQDLPGVQGSTVEKNAKETAKAAQDPDVAWAAKTGRAYDRRFTRLWRQFEGKKIGDWFVRAVNRRFRDGDHEIQPDLVLVNDSQRRVVIHDYTSTYDPSHIAKGKMYQKFFQKLYPDYNVEYSEGHWRDVTDFLEALSRRGKKYIPGQHRP